MLKPIKNKKQYEEALSRAYALMQKELKPSSKESDELEVLSILLKEYEQKIFPVPKPNPLEAIKFRLEQMEITEAELSEILGYRSRKSEILSGKRKLSLSMIRKLHETLGIHKETLTQAYQNE
ncbi:MAG TPA: transcriptional regulator, partial [Cyclobacteriaceae bacterium]|nr:transcriptional regulator [Cyclobacteriaceae bacterium]